MLIAFGCSLLFPQHSPAEQLLNISTRAYVGPDDHVLIGGFIVTGSAQKRLLLRGLGPSLSEVGLSGVLSNPVLEMRDKNGTLIAANDDWKVDQRPEIESTGLAPKDDRESAIVIDLRYPESYTALLRGANNTTGIGLVEVYDLSPNTGSVLANISTRGNVEPGDRVMIGGFIVGGPDPVARFIARGIGPSLSGAGIADSLADPTLRLMDSNGVLLSENDDWKSSPQLAFIEQSGLAPADDRESAVFAELGAGNYTVLLNGNGNGMSNATGIGLVELYRLEGSANPTTYSFSFENNMESWTPKATDVDHPDEEWSIERSQDRATDGAWSLHFQLSNNNDAGKIWIERPFAVAPNRFYHVTVQFSFATADGGDANHFNIITGVRASPAVTRSDLTFQGDTGNGESPAFGYKWLEKSYGFNVASGPDGVLYMDLGIWGNWETFRAYYFDNVRVTITEN